MAEQIVIVDGARPGRLLRRGAEGRVGETVVAVVSLAEDATLDLEAVREFAASRIARYKLPRRLQIVQAVPRNASGKLDKVTIRQLVEDQ
jgi:fatty-acyl-CoA synthase